MHRRSLRQSDLGRRWSERDEELDSLLFFFLFFFNFNFLLFIAELEACGSSQARGQIGAATASLCHRHSNMGCKPSL